VSVIRSFYERMMGRAQGCDGHESDPRLGDSDILRILWRTGWKMVRGSSFSWRLGDFEGPFFVSRTAQILHPRHLHIGPGVKVEDLAEVHCLSRRGVWLGAGVTIGRGASIRPSSYYGGELGEGLRVGDGTAIGAYSWIGASAFVEIGSKVLFGPRVVVIPENHNFDDVTIPIKEQGTTRAGVTIGDNCWIGANATILSGVHIGPGSIVAANSVVNRNVPSYSIVAGAPARLIRSRKETGEAKAA
jgi:acetyltransferase-like isoleucine patch superfamily enzyme